MGGTYPLHVVCRLGALRVAYRGSCPTGGVLSIGVPKPCRSGVGTSRFGGARRYWPGTSKLGSGTDAPPRVQNFDVAARIVRSSVGSCQPQQYMSQARRKSALANFPRGKTQSLKGAPSKVPSHAIRNASETATATVPRAPRLDGADDRHRQLRPPLLPVRAVAGAGSRAGLACMPLRCRVETVEIGGCAVGTRGFAAPPSRASQQRHRTL